MTTGVHQYKAPTVALGDVVDQFHDEDGLSHARAAEETNLSTPLVRCEQVDDLRSDPSQVSTRTDDVVLLGKKENPSKTLQFFTLYTQAGKSLPSVTMLGTFPKAKKKHRVPVWVW
jgi:hypothetical protein